jgi:hypothetical protein
MKKTALFALAASAPLTLAAGASTTAWAAEADAPIATAAEAPATASELVVQAQIAYRNRTDQAAPVLNYNLDYFQRFEPLTAGDALKRVPSVAFLSDVLESDGVRLRGLDPAYTQILINGEKVPGAGSGSGAFGSGADSAFFVDRIPAELIERIEIVRSASANRSGDAVAGAINIVLRDAYALDGGFVRAGALMFDDKRIRETVGGVWGGQVGPGRLLVGANLQGRRNPKNKLSLRYDEPGAPIDNSELQTDVRNGTDYSFNASYQTPLAGGDLDLSGFYVHTDRYQNEDSIEYNKDIRDNAHLSTLNDNDVDIEQDSYSVNGKYSHDMFGGATSVKLGYASFKDKEAEFEDETEYLRDATPYPDGDRITRDKSRTNLEDTEFSAKLEHKRDLSQGRAAAVRRPVREEAARPAGHRGSAQPLQPAQRQPAGLRPLCGDRRRRRRVRADPPGPLCDAGRQVGRAEVGSRPALRDHRRHPAGPHGPLDHRHRLQRSCCPRPRCATA